MSEVRLIDANALKEALRSNCKPELCHDINTAWCESCCRTNDFEDLLDNAPTVPQDCSACKRYDTPYFEVKFDKEQMQELVDKAKAEVLANIERPKGEWQITKAGFAKCPYCRCEREIPENFCGYCGADMKGGKEE